MRGAEGIATVRPGRSSKSTRSEGSKNYIRNVEAVGSNPITSTKSPGQWLEGGFSGSPSWVIERYVGFVEVAD